MNSEERRLMRHEREQERNRKEAQKAYEKAESKLSQVKELFGTRSKAYKKAKEEKRKAKANLNVAQGKRTMFFPSKKKQARRDASPSATKLRRQEKEYITGKDVDTSQQEPKERKNQASGGMIGAADMSAKKTSAPKKKKMPQYYMGGGMIKKGKKYAYGGRVAKYKG